MAVINLGSKSIGRKCSGGFLRSYLDYAEYLEGPEDFNLWVGVALIGLTLGRRCWLSLGFDKIYPNLYTVLVGPSAVGKGMAMSAGRRILVESLGDHGVPILAQKTSTEALIEHLKEITEEDSDRGALIWSPEFSNLIGKSKYDQSLIQDLTDYYDCLDKKTYRTIGRGETTINNICVSLLAASTPEWLKSSMPEDSIGGGFLSRLLIINRLQRGKRVARPKIENRHIVGRQNCVNDLKIINKISGEFTLDEKAYRMYATWYEDYLDEELKEAGPNLESYYERKKLLVLKISMIARASFDESLEIKSEDVEFAINILGENEEFLKKIVRHMGLTDTGKSLNKIRKHIQKNKKLGRSKLLQRIDMSAAELDPLIDTLVDIGEIKSGYEGAQNKKLIYTWVDEDTDE